MKLPAMLDIFPGFRIIPESPTYPISDTVSGTVIYFSKDGSMQRLKFHLVNTLFRPDQMVIFNISQLTQFTLTVIMDNLLDDTCQKAFAIDWDKSTGLAH
jgi:hypothetical protein